MYVKGMMYMKRMLCVEGIAKVYGIDVCVCVRGVLCGV